MSIIQKEIQAIMRQITSSVSFLPLLNEPCTFDLLVYTDKNTDIPKTWEESEPKYVQKSAKVRLRSFTTKIHKVDTLVSYKLDEEI
jgi:mitotic spindle assembly checkpoint protein MAD2